MGFIYSTLPTDPRWANIAEGNLEEILTDHAWCELKAASNAIMLINMLPEFTEITTELTKIAKEEMDHFEQARQKAVASDSYSSFLLSSL